MVYNWADVLPTHLEVVVLSQSRRVSVLGASLVAALVGVSACSAQRVEPKLELLSAATETNDQRSVSYEVSLAGGEGEVSAFLRSDPSSTEAPVMDESMTRLLSSSFTLTLDKGESEASTDDDRSRLNVSLGDLDAAEVVSGDGSIFLRADVDGVERDLPGTKEVITELRNSVETDPAFASLAPLLEGDWVSATPESKDAPARPSASVPDVRPLADALRQAVEDSSTVTREGEDEAGEQLRVSLDSREAVTRVREALPEVLEGTPAAAALEKLPEATDVPDAPLVLDVWVKKERVTKVEVDLAQLTDSQEGSLTLRVVVGAGDQVELPTGASEVDLETIRSAMESVSPDASVQSTRQAAEYLNLATTTLASLDGVPAGPEQVERITADVDPSYTVTVVGAAAQVAGPDGAVACLVFSGEVGVEGTVSDGACA